MAEHDVLLDCDHFDGMIWLNDVADPWSAEREANLPERFRRNYEADYDQDASSGKAIVPAASDVATSSFVSERRRCRLQWLA